MENENDIDNDHDQPTAEAEPANAGTRPRKRRRRTVACTQCRSRKLKCDREYPSCGRCLKSKIPERCTYEDSFVWQQPNTVTAAAPPTSSPDRFSSNHITLPPPNRVAAASPGFGGSLPAYPKSVTESTTPLQPLPQSLLSSRVHNVSTPDFQQAGSARPRFLDTVLDNPNPPPTSKWTRTADANTNQPGHSANSYPQAPPSPSRRLEISNNVIIRGKETRTRFNGGGMVSNLMLQVC